MRCGDLHNGVALLVMTNGVFIKVLKGLGSFSVDSNKDTPKLPPKQQCEENHIESVI